MTESVDNNKESSDCICGIMDFRCVFDVSLKHEDVTSSLFNSLGESAEVNSLYDTVVIERR